MFQFVLSFAISVIASALLTWGVRNFARRNRLAMAIPSSRHIHSLPTPRLGGVAVFMTFSAMFSLYLLAGKLGWAVKPGREVSIVALVSIGFFGIGLLDDLKGLSAWSKLLVQVGGATVLFLSGIHFGICSSLIFSPGISRFLCWLATVFWVVLICNAINLIDGLDGLAAGSALFSMVTIFSLAVSASTGLATATMILAGSVVGFLIFNFNPASIFLGDSGSLFIGFMLSGCALAESQRQHSALDAVFVPLVAFALPLTDVVVSVARRFLSGHSLFGADREHIHHKLLALGLTQRQVVWVLYSFSAFSALLSLFIWKGSDSALLPVMGFLLVGLFFGLRKLDYHEFTEFGRVWKRAAQQKKIFARNIAVRKAAARLETARDSRLLFRTLEACLREDFDGFEIILEDALVPRNPLPAPWRHGAVKQFWKASPEEVIFKLELTATDGVSLGSLALYQGAGSELLIDTELLKGHLRDAVAMALQNILQAPHLNTIALSAMESLPLNVAASFADHEVRG